MNILWYSIIMSTTIISKETFDNVKVIAVIGCSACEGKAAHDVPVYMKDAGYTIVPINPWLTEKGWYGAKAYTSLTEAVADGIEIDIVNFFRPGDQCLPYIEEALRLNPRPKLLWLQAGIENEIGREKAEAAGVPFVQSKCLKVEHRRLI